MPELVTQHCAGLTGKMHAWNWPAAQWNGRRRNSLVRLPCIPSPPPHSSQPLQPATYLRLGGNVRHVFSQAEGAVEGGLRGNEGGEACRTKGGSAVRVTGQPSMTAHIKAGLCPTRRKAQALSAPMLLPTLAKLAMSKKCCGASGVRNSRLQKREESSQLSAGDMAAPVSPQAGHCWRRHAQRACGGNNCRAPLPLASPPPARGPEAPRHTARTHRPTQG